MGLATRYWLHGGYHCPMMLLLRIWVCMYALLGALPSKQHSTVQVTRHWPQVSLGATCSRASPIRRV